MQDGDHSSGAGLSSNWLGFGSAQRVTVASSSPAGASNEMSGIAHDLDRDDASFAESFRLEASPLFNPMFLSHNMEAEAAPSQSQSSNLWHRHSSAVESSTVSSVRQPSPPVQGASILNSSLSILSEKPASQGSPISAEPVVSKAHAPMSPLQQSAAQDENEAVLLEEEKEEDVAPGEKVFAVLDVSVEIEEERVEETPESMRQTVEDQQEHLAEQINGITAQNLTDTSSIDQNQTPQAAGDVQELTESIPTPTVVRLPSVPKAAFASTESATRMSAPLNATTATVSNESDKVRRAQSTPGLVVELKRLSEPEKSTFEETPIPDDLASSPARSGADISPAAPSSTRTRRRTIAAPTKATGKSPAKGTGRRRTTQAGAGSTLPTRKSMPAIATDGTPKQRGHPRKGEVATPSTVPESDARRGRPRKSDITPAAKTPVAKLQASRIGRPSNASKASASAKKAPQPASAAATLRGRPRKSVQAAEETPATTPKKRGRPAKNTPQATSVPAKSTVVVPSSASRVSKSVDATPAKKRGRAIKPHIVPSPIKRGRKATSPIIKTASKPSATRGRHAVAQSKKHEPVPVAETAAGPKRRGRPPKNNAVAAAAAAAAAQVVAPEPKSKKRGRAAANVDNEPTEGAAPATKRGRTAKAVTQDAPAPAARKTRGRAAAAKDVPQVTTDKAAPTKKRGRAANATEEAAAAPAPKRRGRAAAATKAAGPEDAPDPKKRGRAAARDSELVSTTTKTRGRPPRAAAEPKEQAEEQAPVMARRGRVAKTTAAMTETTARKAAVAAAEAPGPKTKGRGRPASAKEAPAEKKEAPAPKPRGRPAKGKSGKGEIASPKSVKAGAPKRGRAAAARTAAKPTGVAKKGRAAQTGVRRGLRSRD